MMARLVVALAAVKESAILTGNAIACSLHVRGDGVSCVESGASPRELQALKSCPSRPKPSRSAKVASWTALPFVRTSKCLHLSCLRQSPVYLSDFRSSHARLVSLVLIHPTLRAMPTP